MSSPPPSPGRQPPNANPTLSSMEESDQHGLSESTPPVLEMTSMAEAETSHGPVPLPSVSPSSSHSSSLPPAPTPSPPATIPAASSPFAFMGANDSDASSELASDSDDDDDPSAFPMKPMTRSILSSQVRPPVTRRESPPFDASTATSTNGAGQSVFVEDFAHGPRAAHVEYDNRSVSPVSVDLPVEGGYTTQPPPIGTRESRVVRLQLPDRPNTVRPHTVDTPEESHSPVAQSHGSSSNNTTTAVNDDDDGGVFAFQRPPTAPRGVADTSSGTVGDSSGSLKNLYPSSPVYPAYRMDEAPLDGWVDERDVVYDMNRPPPYSGRDNLNNSVFAFGLRNRGDRSRQSTAAGYSNKGYPPDTATTMTTELSFGGDHGQRPGQGRFMRVSRRDLANRPPTGRPSTGRPSTMASSFIPESEWTSSDGESGYRPRTMDSHAVTDMTGDQTVPDGVTTWGDGLGGERKSSPDLDEPTWIDEDSPYAEVRASVSNLDDPDMPALTLRSWVLGMFLVCISGGANIFFSFRNPSPHLPVIVVQVVAYPMGRFLAWLLPIREWTVPRWLGGFTFSLNPCPFNVKEHTIIVMMATVAIAPAFGMNTIVVSDVWYHRPLGVGFSFLYILATQVTGLAMAGITRRFVVWPASMIWPGVLVNTTNLNTLHAEADRGSGGMSRLRFFLVVALGAFAYYFLPGFLFTGLSYFSYVCWAAPNNSVVNQLFGISTGLGMGILNFDWAQIAWIGNPLANPWWAQVNIAIGFVLFYWIIVPIIYYTNTWYTAHLPISSLQAADRFANVYNVSALITPEYALNTTAYAKYSPVYLTATFTMTYMLAFGLTTALLVYTGLVHGKRLVQTIRKIQVEPEDIHMKLMKVYPEVPDWWYLSTLLVCVILAIVTLEVFGAGLPVWGYLVSLAMAFLYIVPSAIMYALTNIPPAINLIAELIPGYAFPGRPLAGMIFKTFAVQSLYDAMSFTRDMKIGHYMKVPPRSMFVAQLSACALSCFMQVGVKEWMFRTIPDMCAPKQKDLLTCAHQRTVYSASIIWGLVGPARLFSKGGLYNPQLWMMLVGALLPIPFWLWVRKHPSSKIRNINVAVIFCVCMFIPPASGINIASFLVVGFIFQYWVRRYRFAWWVKYNYVLAAALDVGTLFSAVFIFLALRLPQAAIDWWGNQVYRDTLDWNGAPLLTTPQGGFGPNTWKV